MSDCVQATLKNETVQIKHFQAIMTLFEPRQPFYFHAIDSVFLSQASVPGCSVLWVVSAHTQEHTHTHTFSACLLSVPGQRQWRTMRVSTSGAQQHFMPERAQTHTQRHGGMSNQHGVIIYRLPHILQQRDGQRERDGETTWRTGPDTTRLSLNRCVNLTVRTQRAAPLKPSALSPPFKSPTNH